MFNLMFNRILQLNEMSEAGMGVGRTLPEWEGLGILKTIPAHL